MDGYTHLLDTNIVSDLARRLQGKAAARLALVELARVCTSLIVVSELRYGVAKKGSERLARQLEQVLAGLDILPYATQADFHYGRIRAALQSAGQPIGGNDLLIAAHALALDAALVTDNEGEFVRVPGLRVENWLRDSPARSA
jgi:tRNA(fMet)-specific endonuclease VapC